MAVKRAVKKAPPKKAVKVVPGRATPPTGMPPSSISQTLPTGAQAGAPATAAPAQGGFAERIAAFRAAMAKKKGKK